MIRFREIRLLRFAYAGYIAARILLGYRRISAKKKMLSEDDYRQLLREHHVRSARRLYDGALRMQGLMIKIGQTLGSRGGSHAAKTLYSGCPCKSISPGRMTPFVSMMVASGLGPPTLISLIVSPSMTT